MSVGHSEPATADGEPLAVVRKKALLRLLCRREAERRGFAASPEEIAAEAVRFRRHFTLSEEADFAAWLAETGLTREAFARAMADIVTVEWIEAHLVELVEALLPSQIAIGSARRRLGTGG